MLTQERHARELAQLRTEVELLTQQVKLAQRSAKATAPRGSFARSTAWLHRIASGRTMWVPYASPDAEGAPCGWKLNLGPNSFRCKCTPQCETLCMCMKVSLTLNHCHAHTVCYAQVMLKDLVIASYIPRGQQRRIMQASS